jgi:hypothetical protein
VRASSQIKMEGKKKVKGLLEGLRNGRPRMHPCLGTACFVDFGISLTGLDIRGLSRFEYVAVPLKKSESGTTRKPYRACKRLHDCRCRRIS